MNSVVRISSALALVMLLGVASATAQAVSGSIEQENTVTSRGATPQVNVYVNGPIKGRLGWNVWSLTSESWSEVLVGLTFAPTKWMSVSPSIGIETNENPLRIGGSIWVGKGRFSFISFQENGGSGHWQRNLAVVKVSKKVGVGVFQQTFVGAGPHAELSVGKFTVWGAYALGDNKGLTGLKFNF